MRDLATFLRARYGEHLERCWELGAVPGSAFARDEYQALREVVDLHKEVLIERPDDDVGIPYDALCDVDSDDFPCKTLCLLALPYADHPDYDDEWRP